MLNPNAEIAHEIIKMLKQSPTLKINDGTLLILSYNISDFINANYELKPKKAWYGVDIKKRINELKQQLAVAYQYSKKENICLNQEKTEEQLIIPLKTKNNRIKKLNEDLS